MSEMTGINAAALKPTLELDDIGTSAAGLERRLLIAMSGGVFLAASWIGNLLGANQLVSQFPAAIGGDHPRDPADLGCMAGGQPGAALQRFACLARGTRGDGIGDVPSPPVSSRCSSGWRTSS